MNFGGQATPVAHRRTFGGAYGGEAIAYEGVCSAFRRISVLPTHHYTNGERIHGVKRFSLSRRTETSGPTSTSKRWIYDKKSNLGTLKSRSSNYRTFSKAHQNCS